MLKNVFYIMFCKSRKQCMDTMRILEMTSTECLRDVQASAISKGQDSSEVLRVVV